MVLSLGFRYQSYGLRGTRRHTKAAPDTAVFIHLRDLVGVYLQGVHLAAFQTGFTTCTLIAFNYCHMIGKDQFRRAGMFV